MDSTKMERKQNATLYFNIAIMIASFTIALIALPQELFFVVAVIILIALREIEKEIAKTHPKGFSLFTKRK